MENPRTTSTPGILHNRWLILGAGILCMIAVANYQYGWTLFVNPLSKALGVSTALIQVSFTIFVLFETWLVPAEAYFADRFGPKKMLVFGGVMVMIGWVLAGNAKDLITLYIAQGVIAGVGAGAVYGTAIGTALKWFPDHRGLAAGVTAAGFGAGSAATVIPVLNAINSVGYSGAFVQWGVIQGTIVILAGLFVSSPPKNWAPAGWLPGVAQQNKAPKRQSIDEFAPHQMLRTPVFWLMYVMMTMVVMGGLMATAQFAPIAAQFKIDKVPVTLLYITLPAIGWTLSLDRILNGGTRPFFGWVSDRLGREKTMTIAFSLEALAIFGLIQVFTNPLLFVLLSGLTFFGWGEVYSLFPATNADFFGRKFATTNYGLLYTAKGTASLFVPFGNVWAATIGWSGVFQIAIVFDVIGAALAFFVLRRMKVPSLKKAMIEVPVAAPIAVPAKA